MEAVQQAIIQAGLDEAQFWDSTPYQSLLRIKAANRSRLEGYLSVGWFAEYFARQGPLQGPQHYIREMLDGNDNPDLAEQTAQAQFNRMALQYGLEIETIEGEPEAE